MTLTEFLLARIAEDKKAATKILGYLRSYEVIDVLLSRTENAVTTSERVPITPPARVLAECEAKRRIVEQASWTGPKDSLRDRLLGPAADEAYRQGIMTALRLLSVPYADHPDYLPEWKP